MDRVVSSSTAADDRLSGTRNIGTGIGAGIKPTSTIFGDRVATPPRTPIADAPHRGRSSTPVQHRPRDEPRADEQTRTFHALLLDKLDAQTKAMQSHDEDIRSEIQQVYH